MMNTVRTGISFGSVTVTQSGAGKSVGAGSTGNAGAVRFTQTKQAKTKKKKLNYNKREVSSQVLRATKLSSASRALATARTKVGTLRRCLGTGQYDDDEVRAAITHAERIVKTAKQKISNLKEEQLKAKHAAREKRSGELKQQVKKQRLNVQRQQVKQEMQAEQTRAEQKAKEEELRYKQMKRRHRGEELAEVTEADLKYLKDMERLRRYGNAESGRQDTSAVTLEIGDSAMRLSELQRTEQALKYEEMQMDAQTAAISAGMDMGNAEVTGGSGALSAAGGSAAEAAAAGGTVDVSV